MRARAVLAASLALALAACGPSTPAPTPTASSTPTPTPTPRATASSTPDASATPAASATPDGSTAAPSSTAEPTDDARTPATPVLANVEASRGTVTVDAYVADVLENGGECILLLDGVEVARGAAEADATVTWCEPLSAPTAGRTGTVSVTVTYSSSARLGTSAATPLELS